MLLLLVGIGAGFAGWALVEARAQRTETAEALASQARVLAGTLGPSLAAAAAAGRELDELLSEKLLSAARLIGRLRSEGILTRLTLERVVDEGDLDSVVVLEANRRIVLEAGEAIPEEVLDTVATAARGLAEELLLPVSVEDGIEHLGAATVLPGGGAVVVRIHAGSGRTFARQLGVGNLLERLVRSGTVLYLRYREMPGDVVSAASWDDEEVPDPAPGLRQVRGRAVFEVDVPVASPAGTEALLTVGLDGAPLLRAGASALRRTVLIGLVLVAFSVAVGIVALVVRWRTLEREQADRLLAEAEAARRRSERLAAAGALTAGLAHEVRSPLNAIQLAAQRIERTQEPGTECARFAGTIRSEVRRLDAVLHQFLELSSPVGDERSTTDLGELAREVRGLLLEEAALEGVTIQPVDGGGFADVDRESIRRGLINLVHNAVEASPRGSSIGVRVAEEDGGVTIRVLDRGSGFDEENAAQLFDAFVTTRAGGTGLGLAQVKRIAEEHGGRCGLAAREGGGTEAVLWMPRGGGTDS
jgi:signal transduction histidine kinase